MAEDEAKTETLAERLARLDEKRKAEQAASAEKTLASDGLFARPAVVCREVFGATTKVELIEFEAAERCAGAPFISGIPGAANGNMTALLVAGYFAKQLELPLVASVRVHGASPQGIVKENAPGLQIRLVGDSRMVCLLAESPLKGGGLAFNLIQAVLSFCARRRVSHLFCVDGVPTPADRMEDAATLRFCTSAASFSAAMKAGDEPRGVAIMNAILPGFAGQLLADAVLAENTDGMDVTGVLVKADERLPSAYPAVHVVKALDDYLDTFEIDVSDLEDSALEMETALSRVLKEAQAQMKTKEAAPKSMYM